MAKPYGKAQTAEPYDNGSWQPRPRLPLLCLRFRHPPPWRSHFGRNPVCRELESSIQAFASCKLQAQGSSSEVQARGSRLFSSGEGGGLLKLLAKVASLFGDPYRNLCFGVSKTQGKIGGREIYLCKTHYFSCLLYTSDAADE